MRDSIKYFVLPLLTIVIGSLIVAGILTLLGVLDLLRIYHFIVKIIVPFFFISVEIPIWQLVHIFLAGPIIIGLSLFLRSRRRASSHPRYTSDKIYGLRWNWDYWYSTAGRKASLTPRCPRFWCKCKLRTTSVYSHVTLLCQHCGFKKTYPCDYATLKERVDTEIDRRINTKAYRFKLIKKPFRILLKLARVILWLIFKWLPQRFIKSSR